MPLSSVPSPSPPPVVTLSSRQALARARRLVRDGATNSEIHRQLLASGLDDDSAGTTAAQSFEQERRSAINLVLWSGGLGALGLVTVICATATGHGWFIAGAMITGIPAMFYGLLRLAKISSKGCK